MNQYQNAYASQPAYPAQNTAPVEGGELLDGATIGADQLGDYDRTYTLLPEGDYSFTVVDLKQDRYQPGQKSKIGPCKRVTITLRVQDPNTGDSVDLYHKLYMWNSKNCIGMIAQFQDSIGIHKKGEPVRCDWRHEILVGKTGTLALNHKPNQDDPTKIYNNIKKLYPQEQPAQNPEPAQGGWTPGRW